MPHRPEPNEKFSLELPPSAVEGAIGRVVKTPDGGVRSEVWRNGSWMPGLSIIEVLDKGRRLSPAECTELGIPDEVHVRPNPQMRFSQKQWFSKAPFKRLQHRFGAGLGFLFVIILLGYYMFQIAAAVQGVHTYFGWNFSWLTGCHFSYISGLCLASA